MRHLQYHFAIEERSKNDVFLVLESLCESLWLYCTFAGCVTHAPILKILIQVILQALDYLHSFKIPGHTRVRALLAMKCSSL